MKLPPLHRSLLQEEPAAKRRCVDHPSDPNQSNPSDRSGPPVDTTNGPTHQQPPGEPSREEGAEDGRPTEEREEMIIDAFAMTSLADALPTQAHPLQQPHLHPPPQPHLPADSWAVVLRYLPLPTILSLTSISRFFLRDVAPSLRRLLINHPTYLHPHGPLRRFVGVQSIDVECLIDIDDDGIRTLCEDVVNRLVPFLAQFTMLQRVWVGGLDPQTGIRYGYKTHYTRTVCRTSRKSSSLPNGEGGGNGGARIRVKVSDEQQNLFRTLIRKVCEGFRNKVLPANLDLRGVVDWDASNEASTYRCEPLPSSLLADANSNNAHSTITAGTTSYECGLCRNILETFPLPHCIHMRCAGDCDPTSSSKSACPSFSRRLSLLASRIGGHGAIRTHALVEAFHRCHHPSHSVAYIPVNEQGHPTESGPYVVQAVHYREDRDWSDVEAVLHYVDATECSYHVVERCLPLRRTSRSNDARADQQECSSTATTTRGKVFITQTAFAKLVSLGFYIHPNDFRIIDPGLITMSSTGRAVAATAALSPSIMGMGGLDWLYDVERRSYPGSIALCSA